MDVIELQAERWMDCLAKLLPGADDCVYDLCPHLGIERQSAHTPGFGVEIAP